MDILALEGMHFYANHGYYAHEQEVGGQYTVDLYLHLDCRKAGLSDQLEDTLNYEIAYELIAKIMSEPKHLIEHIAYQILEQVTKSFAEVERAKIRVTNLQPPLKGNVAKTFIEVERDLQKLSNNDSYWEQRAKY